MTKHYIFFNFTDKPFTGYWNGKPYTFKPGIKKQYTKGIARHFAKHLTNQILTEIGKEKATSPKKPWEVKEFMDVFEKALIIEEIPDEDNLDINDADSLEINEPSMNVKVEPRDQIDPYDASANKSTGPGNAPQVIGKVEDSGEADGTDDAESGYEEPETPPETPSEEPKTDK